MSDFATRRMMMVDTQVRPSDVTKFPIIEAMLQIPREAYVPSDKRDAAYIGENVDLGNARVMLDPRSFAKMLDALDLQPSDFVLDLGVGLGYSSAVIARMVESVIALEGDEALAGEAERILAEQGVDNAVVLRGPLEAGNAKHGPYDVIVLQGGIEVMPPALEAQLKEGGRIGAIFIDGALGTARIGIKTNGRITWRNVFHASAPVLAGFEKSLGFAL